VSAGRENPAGPLVLIAIISRTPDDLDKSGLKLRTLLPVLSSRRSGAIRSLSPVFFIINQSRERTTEANARGSDHCRLQFAGNAGDHVQSLGQTGGDVAGVNDLDVGHPSGFASEIERRGDEGGVGEIDARRVIVCPARVNWGRELESNFVPAIEIVT